jgi:hypothetical protein
MRLAASNLLAFAGLLGIEHRRIFVWRLFTLAIGHMSAYTCGITDQTLGVSG